MSCNEWKNKLKDEVVKVITGASAYIDPKVRRRYPVVRLRIWDILNK